MYLLLTVYCYFPIILPVHVKKFRRGQGAPVFVEGGACATAQWHNGQSKPDIQWLI